MISACDRRERNDRAARSFVAAEREKRKKKKNEEKRGKREQTRKKSKEFYDIPERSVPRSLAFLSFTMIFTPRVPRTNSHVLTATPRKAVQLRG